MVDKTAIAQLNDIMRLTEDINTAARRIQQVVDNCSIDKKYISDMYELAENIRKNAGEVRGYAMGICFNLHSAEQQTPTGRGSLRLVK